MVLVKGDDLREAGVTRAGGVDKLGQGSGGRVREHICDMNPIHLKLLAVFKKPRREVAPRGISCLN